ncbi:hypothetical protein [Klebsiella aerogenes]|uniref:hypothetical protein n=1 Tax=Klebsiella aerogenes TaxID=548 RepID=UPI0021CF486E|nr:hypothetical protein [Klebsiella aerogenes]MCU6317015.1 hypothetical protein [Klebsiella aerogenes]
MAVIYGGGNIFVADELGAATGGIQVIGDKIDTASTCINDKSLLSRGTAQVDAGFTD